MGGVNVDSGGGGGRKSLDSEINMIPMIDLLMVTISFLLITAVWSNMAQLHADAQVPGPPRPDDPVTPPKVVRQLNVDMRTPDKFTLTWKEGSQVVSTFDVPRTSTVQDKSTESGVVHKIAFPELAAEVQKEWGSNTGHNSPTDKVLDQAILHTDNTSKYYEIVAAIDAIYSTQRPIQYDDGQKQSPAFNVTFAVN